MIIVKLQGGLGNQMFQYACARGVQKQNESLFLDLCFLQKNTNSTLTFTARPFELKIFDSLKASRATPFLENVLYSQNLQYKVLRKVLYSRIKAISQKENELITDLLSIKGNVYLNGYFQSEKYFSSIRHDLINEFRFPELDQVNLFELNKINSYENSVCIHVRRGDYLNAENANKHGVLPLSYYFKATQFLEASVCSPHYFIFSDDTEWCRENMKFIKGRITFINSKLSSDAWKDMFLMTQCKHHIIANSSFSWWGAWLSQNEGGLNFAPCKWFNPEVTKFDIHDFVPATWQIVQYD